MDGIMTLKELKEYVDKAIKIGKGDALVLVQANADHISDIEITDCYIGYDFNRDTFNLESN